MARILGVGNATLDIVNSVDRYPSEDSEQRATSQRIGRGGNTANTLVVLSQLGHECSWAGVLADEPDAKYIYDDFDCHQIDWSPAHQVTQGKVPTSYIVSNQHNGSRTIIHVRDLPEYLASHFSKLVLDDYDWLHFEGRNIAEVKQMMEYMSTLHPDIPVSLEIEKQREGIEQLFDYPDVLIFSRTFVEQSTYYEPMPFLTDMRKLYQANYLICCWGEQGAYAIDEKGESIHSPAHPVSPVVETLGAGDTFNAALINALIQQEPLGAALYQACELAAYKCGITGFKFELDNDREQEPA
ncbi:MAG: ketohexokinase [Gammaproteobacteria bacterium]|nr:ketohexokinase [Gammaproteobacteria bacterium]